MKHHEPKDGEYYYFPKGDMYSVYQNHDDGDGHGSGDKIKDCLTKKQASEMVYKLNGWDKK